jgi:hypothetical protein
MPGTTTARPPQDHPRDLPRERPAWLVALDGLCLPCADAEFYGVRKRHAECERGECRCQFTVPSAWPPGTWAA